MKKKLFFCCLFLLIQGRLQAVGRTIFKDYTIVNRSESDVNIEIVYVDTCVQKLINNSYGLNYKLAIPSGSSDSFPVINNDPACIDHITVTMQIDDNTSISQTFDSDALVAGNILRGGPTARTLRSLSDLFDFFKR